MALTSVETYLSPENEAAVVQLLQQYEDSALIVAGGTFLHGLAARGLLTGVEALIDIQNSGLDYVTADSAGIVIGAAARFVQLEQDESVRQQPWLGAVKDAISYPPVQIMNSATVGGSIAASCPFFDLPVSFLALGGAVRARGPGGSRDIPMEAFFTGLFENCLDPDEFVTAITLPQPAPNTSSAFIKLETNANDLAILNAAVALTLDGSNTCSQARVFVGGGTGETPARAGSAEQALAGAVVDAETIDRAAQAAKSDVDPISDHRASAEYRAEMARVLVARAIRKALERAG